MRFSIIKLLLFLLLFILCAINVDGMPNNKKGGKKVPRTTAAEAAGTSKASADQMLVPVKIRLTYAYEQMGRNVLNVLNRVVVDRIRVLYNNIRAHIQPNLPSHGDSNGEELRSDNAPNPFPSHSSVVVGDYEYDMLQYGVRRRIFRHDIDMRLKDDDKRKAQPFKVSADGLLAESAKADKLFFEMAERFWSNKNIHPRKANCMDFVYNFVYALCDGKPPSKELWPNNFLEHEDYNTKYKYNKKGLDEQLGKRVPPAVFDRRPIALPNWPTDKQIYENGQTMPVARAERRWREYFEHGTAEGP